MEFIMKGIITGMDISSAVAVKALEIQAEDHVLDLCCAPGAKLCYISEQLGPLGTATGVDISPWRLATCRRLLLKHQCQKTRLFAQGTKNETKNVDGTLFNVHAVHRLGNQIRFEGLPPDKVYRPFYASKWIRHDLQLQLEPRSLYDKVLVDAECTHDGSMAHIKKYDSTFEPGQFDTQVLDQTRLNQLESLQRQLLLNGYRLLKPGGILVYSTCSFSKKQNEDIVEWFLTQQNAVLQDIPHKQDYPAISQGSLTLRFSPEHSNTSGFFVARFQKPIS
jgi:16S rRNA C967 or C1407 C5-methylase (RsmB/RsmF family)